MKSRQEHAAQLSLLYSVGSSASTSLSFGAHHSVQAKPPSPQAALSND